MSHKKNVVLVGGCFDILHPGHVFFLDEAKKLGNTLCIALESDEFIIRHKQRKPLFIQEERKRMLMALKSVDQVIELPLLHDYHDYLLLAERVKPSVIAITEGDPQFANKQIIANKVHAKLVVACKKVPGKSTSSIIALLSKM